MEALDFEVWFAVARDSGHSQAGSVENWDSEAFNQRRADKTQGIQIEIKLGTFIHISSENNPWFMGNDFFQGFTVIVTFELASNAKFNAFIIKIWFGIGFCEKKKILASFNRRIKQEIAKGR